MTRYSRSVLPGRADEVFDQGSRDAAPHDTGALDNMIFGAKRQIRPPAPPANNDEPDFLPPMGDDEADLLVKRSNTDRRGGTKERRTNIMSERRQAPGRRASEYAPLRSEGRARPPEDSKRGPLLLLGALLIVAVFAFVVWNAYRDGLQSDEVEVTPELSTAGSFKTPPRLVEPAPVVTEPTEVTSDIPLDGGADALDEERPIPLTPPPAAKPVEQAAAPAPSKVMAPPPAPLKPPVQATVPPPQQAAAKPPAATPAKPTVTAAAPPPKPVPAAASPAPAASATHPTFASYGDHVVQIAATSSEASANAEWTKLLKAHPDMLTGGEKFIQQADVNGKTFYRLRVGSFASKAEATAFCAAFKAKGGACLPAVK